MASRAGQRARVRFAVAACASVALLFALCGARARANLRRATVAAFPALEVHDIATTPLPTNPACWEGLVAGEQGGSYRVLRATVALAPLEAADCNAGMDVEPTAPVEPLEDRKSVV